MKLRVIDAIHGVGGSRPHRVRKEELADAEPVAASGMIVHLADEIRQDAATGSNPDLGSLTVVLNLFQELLTVESE